MESGDGSDEKVLGGLEVETQLRFGSEHLFLLFTQRRMLFAHLAKMGKSSAVLSNLLGKFSRGLSISPGKGNRLSGLASIRPETILARDRDNFGVDYNNVVGLTIEPSGPDRSRIVLVTRDMKIELAASLVAVEGLRELISSLLGEKAVVNL